MALQFVSDQIKDSAVINAKIADSTIAFAKLASASYETDLASSASASKLVTAAASKAYADSVASGLDLKESCMVATTANITLSGTQTIDGVSVTAGKRVLVKDQSTGSENGIYVCAAGSWARASDFAAGSAEAGAFTFIEQGTANGDNGFVCTNNAGSDVVGTNALTFTQFSGAGQITAGDGLAKSGNTLSVNVDDSSIEINSDSLRVKASGISNAMLAGSIANAKLANSTISGVALGSNLNDLTVDDSSIQLNSGTTFNGSAARTMSIKASGVTNAMLAGSIVDSKLSTISTAGKVLLSALEIDGGTDIGADLVDADLMIVDDGAGGTNRKSALSRVKKYIYSAMSGDATASDAGALTIAAGAVGTAMVADNAITLAKMDGLARGKIIYGDASGNPAALAAGANGKLLVADANGDLSWTTVSGDIGLSAGAMTIQADAVEQSMIADDAVGADQLASNAVVTASIVNSNVTFAKAAFVPHQESFAGDGSTTAFNLTNRIATAAWRQSIIVFRNGQKINFNGSPSDSSQYSISDNGSTTTVTLGGAPASGEDVTLFYIYE